MKKKAVDENWQDKRARLMWQPVLSHRGERAMGAAIKGLAGELLGISWIPEIRAASPPHRHEVSRE